jgi:hypothetical protein
VTPEQLAQWRADAAYMREFVHSPEWAVLRRHLEALQSDALAQEDLQPPDAVDAVMHYRAARLAFAHALRLPETIVRQAEQVARVADQARTARPPQKGRRPT